MRCTDTRVSTMTDSNDRDRDRQSLRDLAKLSQQTGPLSSSAPASVRNMPPPSSGVADNSGLIDLARLSEAIRSTTEGKSETSMPHIGANVESVLPVASAAAPADRATMPSNLEATPLSPAVELIEQTIAKNAPPAAAPVPFAASSSKLPLVAAAVLLVAVGGFLATRKGAEEPAASAPPPVAAAPTAEVQAAPTPAPAAAAPTIESAPAKVDVVATTKTAPPAAAATAPAGEAKVEAPAGEAKVADKAAAPADAKAAPKGPATKTAKSFEDEMAAAVTGKLQTAQTAEVAGGGAAAAGPAAGMAKPSQGQVQAAFAKVKGAAHNCLGGQEVEVKTTVTFSSDGKVQRVAVSNAPAADMGSCIEGAIAKASVPPFTDPTFSAPLTVR